MALATFTTGVLPREWPLSSLSCALVHRTSFPRFAFLAIYISNFDEGIIFEMTLRVTMQVPVCNFLPKSTAVCEQEIWLNRAIHHTSHKTPAELSVLVHEMVHHLQNVEQLKFACPLARGAPCRTPWPMIKSMP
jgi:hypothetical protein